MRLLALLLVLSFAGRAHADSLQDVFKRGNAAFARGDHEAALEEFSALTEAGIDDPDVAFNLASTYGALGRYGQAIRYFQRSLRLDPGDAAARDGLRLARETLGERQARARGEAIVVDRPPLTEAVFSFFSADQLAWGLLITAWLAVGLLLALPAARVEGVRLGLGIGAALFAALALTAALGVGAKADWGKAGTRALIVREGAQVREGPDDRATLLGELAEGEAVRLLAREGRFARILTGGEREAYVLGSDVGEL
ncbi:MAG TPA: tetratricopeptide repeat protein [Polyangiales bacterium]|nr:tetratricopeptide repeat protein [Polyangiales bacterium]